MFCSKCGQKLEEGVLFCPNCGAKLIAQPTLLTALKNYSDFCGRASRQEFWFFILLDFLVSSALSGIFAWRLIIIWNIALIVPRLAVCVRRMHDLGSRGTRIFCYLIPVVGPIAMFCWMLHDSQPGINRFGANPKGVMGSDPEWRFKSWIGWTIGLVVLAVLVAGVVAAHMTGYPTPGCPCCQM